MQLFVLDPWAVKFNDRFPPVFWSFTNSRRSKKVTERFYVLKLVHSPQFQPTTTQTRQHFYLGKNTNLLNFSSWRLGDLSSCGLTGWKLKSIGFYQAHFWFPFSSKHASCRSTRTSILRNCEEIRIDTTSTPFPFCCRLIYEKVSKWSAKILETGWIFRIQNWRIPIFRILREFGKREFSKNIGRLSFCCKYLISHAKIFTSQCTEMSMSSCYFISLKINTTQSNQKNWEEK